MFGIIQQNFHFKEHTKWLIKHVKKSIKSMANPSQNDLTSYLYASIGIYWQTTLSHYFQHVFPSRLWISWQSMYTLSLVDGDISKIHIYYIHMYHLFNGLNLSFLWFNKLSLLSTRNTSKHILNYLTK